jgi:succinate-acetate transporter protein
MSRDYVDPASRTTYERFLEFERLMKVYPAIPTSQRFNPTPVGFSAFALTLFVFSMHNAGATVPATTTPGVGMGLALFYGGLILLLAGLLEFRVGNNFYALTFCSYAGFWFGRASLYVSSFGFMTVYGSDTTLLNNSYGVFYLGWTIFTAAMFVSALRTNLSTALFFFFLTLTFLLITASRFLQLDPNLLRAGGAFGILTAAISWYAAFASLHIKGENSYFNLPMFSLVPKAPIKMSEQSAVEVRSHIV